MFKYKPNDSCNTVIAFDPESNNTWNKQNLLQAYKDQIDMQKKGTIEDSDGFLVYEYGFKF